MENKEKQKEFFIEGKNQGVITKIKITMKNDGAIFISDLEQSDGGFVYFYPKEAKKLLRILLKQEELKQRGENGK